MLGSELGVCNRPTDWRASDVAGCCSWPWVTFCPLPGSWPWLFCPADEAARLDLRLSLFDLKWHWMCVLRCPDVLKRSSQKGHLKGLEPVCRRMCTFRLPFVEKEVLHMWQLNSFWPAKISMNVRCSRPDITYSSIATPECSSSVSACGQKVLSFLHFFYGLRKLWCNCPGCCKCITALKWQGRPWRVCNQPRKFYLTALSIPLK